MKRGRSNKKQITPRKKQKKEELSDEEFEEVKKKVIKSSPRKSTPRKTPRKQKKIVETSSEEEIELDSDSDGGSGGERKNSPIRKSPRFQKKDKIEEEKAVENPTTTNTLKRSDTLELATEKEEEATLTKKVSSLLHRSSSLKGLLGEKENELISTLSFEAQNNLERNLSEIFSSFDEEIITTSPFSRIDIREFEGSLTSAEEEESPFFDLPTELLVAIFEEMNDKDRWNLAKTCKRLYLMFNLYVGWNELPIYETLPAVLLKNYSEPPSNGLSSSEIHYLRPDGITTSYAIINDTDLNIVSMNINSHYFDHGGHLFFIVESGEEPDANFALKRRMFYHNRTSPIDLSKKKVIGCISFSAESPSLAEFVDIDFLSLFLGKDTQITFKGEIIKGRDHKKHFITSHAIFSNNPHGACAAIRFCLNAKELGSTIRCQPDLKICKLLKWILLQSLFRQVLASAHLIKWSKPSQSILTRLDPVEGPKGLNIPLYDYQKRGLAWLLDVEKNVMRRRYRFCCIHPAPAFPVCDFYMKCGPFDFEDESNFELIRESDDVSFLSRPDLYDTYSIRGGIMADEMGLGKTVTMIALMLANPRTVDEKGNFNLQPGEWRKRAQFEIKGNLVICPSHLVPQWEKEIKNRSSEKLNIITITTINHLRNLTYREIIEADVVIASNSFVMNNKNYLTLCGDLDALRDRVNTKIDLDSYSPILQHFGWHRIILDEGHEVLSTFKEKIQKAEGKKIFKSFRSTFRWYVSGTPVPRGRYSLVGALNFLDIQLKSGIELDEEIVEEKIIFEMTLFDAVKKNFFWRNEKESIKQSNIPNLSEKIIFLQLSTEERALYELADYDNSEENMRKICAQAMESPLLKKMDIISLDNFYANFLKFIGASLKDNFDYIFKCSNKISDEKRKIEHYQTEIVKYTADKHVHWEFYVNRNQQYCLSCQKEISSAEEAIKIYEQKIIAIITRAAVISKRLDPDRKRDNMELLKMQECVQCHGYLWKNPIDFPPKINNICKHTFCFDCADILEKSNLKCRTSCRYSGGNYYYNPPSLTNFLPPSSPFLSLFTKIFINNNVEDNLNKEDENKIKIEEINNNNDEKKNNNNNDNGDGGDKNKSNDNNNNNNNNNEKNNNNNNNDKNNNKNIIIKEEEGELNLITEEDLKHIKDKKKRNRMKELNQLHKLLYYKYGTKISSMIHWTYRLLSSDETTKVIVFSKSETFLNQFGKSLLRYFRSNPTYDDELSEDEDEAKEINLYVTCKGNATVRRNIIEKFNSRQKKSPRVLLLSLQNAASGTHLTVASHIILADTVEGTKEEVKSADAQAIARAHRIGQEKEVVVVRFIVADSIEYSDYLKAYA